MIPIPVISHRRSPGHPVCVKRTLGFHLVTPHQSHWGWDCEKDGGEMTGRSLLMLALVKRGLEGYVILLIPSPSGVSSVPNLSPTTTSRH